MGNPSMALGLARGMENEHGIDGVDETNIACKFICIIIRGWEIICDAGLTCILVLYLIASVTHCIQVYPPSSSNEKHHYSQDSCLRRHVYLSQAAAYGQPPNLRLYVISSQN